jgi:hypothetical protein
MIILEPVKTLGPAIHSSNHVQLFCLHFFHLPSEYSVSPSQHIQASSSLFAIILLFPLLSQEVLKPNRELGANIYKQKSFFKVTIYAFFDITNNDFITVEGLDHSII